MFYRLTLLTYSLMAALGLGWLLAGQVQATGTAVASPPALPQGIHNLIVADDGVRFSLHTPTYTLTAEGVLDVPGLETWRSEGVPQLPIYQTWLAVPTGAQIQLDVRPLGLRYDHVPGVRATGSAQLVADPQNPTEFIGVNTGPTTLAFDKTASGFFPTLSYELSEVQQSGDVSLVNLRLYPVQYNPATAQVRHIQELAVAVSFVGGTAEDGHPETLSLNQAQWLDRVLNPEHVRLSQPPRQSGRPATAVRLPVGETTYKISITTEGIHEVTYAQLASLGVTGSINPAQIQMMHNGQTVAHQHLDANSNNLFDTGDAIRFYGWPFDGSRFEKFYATENVFWLWLTGTADPIATASAAPSGGAGTAVNTTTATHTFGEEMVFWRTSLYVTHWDASPNEPDFFFWKRLYPDFREDPNLVTLTLPITLPHPAPLAMAQATFEAEINTVTNYDGPAAKIHEVWLDVNDLGFNDGLTLPLRANNNIVAQIPQTALAPTGVNTVSFHVPNVNAPGLPCGTLNDCLMLNEVRVAYTRLLVVDDDQLAFDTAATGLLDVAVSGFSDSNVLLWEISDRYQPIRLTGGTVTGAQNQLAFSRNMAADGRFIAFAPTEVKPTTGQISPYMVAETNPPSGANWVAISHSAFITEAQRLADYRASATGGGYQTAALDAQDLINQYGYGIPSPTGIHAYLQEALDDWETPPHYVLLVGSADFNNRLLECAPVCNPSLTSPIYDFDITNTNQLPTYFTFRDRFQGLIPSDHGYSLLAGDDYLPDIALGRFSVLTLAEAEDVVDKIIQYEANQLTWGEWQYNMALLYDNTDAGGDFRQGFINMRYYIPDRFEDYLFGLTTGNTPAETAAVRYQLTQTIGVTNVSMLAYRGHGSVDRWAGEGLLRSSDFNTTNIANSNRPFVSLSMDCLDGNFAYPGWTSLSRAFLIQDNGRGSAAHWSSTGLGYDYEHTILANAFMDATFNRGYTAVGDAVNHAKTIYGTLPFSTSELFSFLLQGDPAMQLYRPEWNISLSAPTETLLTGSEFDVTLNVHNTGLYPSRPVVTYTIPPHVAYITHTAALTPTVAITTTVDNGQQLVFTFDGKVAYDEEVDIDIRLEMVDEGVAFSTAEVSGTGTDISPTTGRTATALLSGQIADVEWNILLLAPSATIPVGGEFDTEFLIQNTGPHPSQPTVTYTLPAHVTYVSHESDVAVNLVQTTLPNGRLQLQFVFNQPVGNSAVLSTQVRLQMGPVSGQAVAEVRGTGRDLSPETGRTATAQLLSAGGWRIYLPFVRK